MPAKALGRGLIQDLARVTGGVSVDVVREWERKHGPLTYGVVAWLAWAPLVKALSLGSWQSDATVRFRRCATGETSDAPVMPSARLGRFCCYIFVVCVRFVSGRFHALTFCPQRVARALHSPLARSMKRNLHRSSVCWKV